MLARLRSTNSMRLAGSVRMFTSSGDNNQDLIGQDLLAREKALFDKLSADEKAQLAKDRDV